MKFTDVFKNKSTAFSFFLSIIVWGIGTGCFAATMNNFLSDMHDMTSQDRGSLEFFREMPGLALVFLFALLNRMSDWKILRLGTMISMLGAALLFVPSNKVIVTFFIMIWSLGEHLIMPVRQAIADSWPNKMDDVCARKEWGWTPSYNLESMTHDMIARLREKLL